MQILQATVLFAAGKAFPSRLANGRDRQSVKLRLDNDEEVSIWFDAGHTNYCSLTRGEVVTVIQDKDRYTVVFPEAEGESDPEATAAIAQQIASIGNAPTPQAAPAIGAARLDPQLKAEIFSELCTRAKILRTCHIQVRQLFTNEDGEIVVNEETLREYATTLYLDLKNFWS